MRPWAPIALSLLVAVTASGCGSGNPPAPKASRAGAAVPAQAVLTADYPTVDGQYQRMQVGLTLPKGAAFPGHLPNTSARYPLNAGTVAAQNYWLCAWLKAYASSTPGTKNQVLQQLPKYSRMDAYTQALDPRGRHAVDTAIRDALTGSKGSVVSFARATCGGPFYGHA